MTLYHVISAINKQRFQRPERERERDRKACNLTKKNKKLNFCLVSNNVLCYCVLNGPRAVYLNEL
jgi:hypothetical protein